jgi:hypothetical protein
MERKDAETEAETIVWDKVWEADEWNQEEMARARHALQFIRGMGASPT